LKEAFSALKSARDSITGQGGGFADAGLDAGMDDEMAGMDAGMDAELGADMNSDVTTDMGPDLEEPEPDAGGAVGRAKR
jgi:hypothetical protein